MRHAEARNAPINIRSFPSQRNLIDKAATAVSKNRSDFILEAACREAEEILLNKRLFFLDEADFKKFDDALKKPLSTNDALQKLLSSKAPWEK